MNGRVSKALRRVAQVDRKADGKRKYYHYNEAKAAKKQKADSSDPIISDGKRQTYRAVKKVFKQLKDRSLTNGKVISWVRGMMSDAAQESLAKGNA